MKDWPRLFSSTDEIDKIADQLGMDLSNSQEACSWPIQLLHSVVLFVTMIERSAFFRLAVWILIISSFVGIFWGDNKSSWAISGLTGMLIIVTQAMTNATRKMAEISQDVSERDRRRSSIRWQASQHPEHPRTVVLTNVSLTTALDVWVSYNDCATVDATAGLENVGAGSSTRFQLPHDFDFDATHWVKIYWKDHWSQHDHDENSATVYIIPSKGVTLRRRSYKNDLD